MNQVNAASSSGSRVTTVARAWSNPWVRLPVVLLLLFLATISLTLAYPHVSSSIFVLTFGPQSQTTYTVSVRAAMFAAMLGVPAAFVAFGWGPTARWLHRWRWALGGAIITAGTAANLNGSSLNAWYASIFNGDLAHDVVFGTPRVLRTDEYIVGTTIAFAQGHNSYGWFNSLFGGRAMDMFMIKDGPVFAVPEIFRPFAWGYLAFGSEYGLAFYWCAKIVVLVLAGYEFFRLLSRDRRVLSLLASCLVAFSPLLQWWFAVNSLPEMVIAVFVAVIAFRSYLRSHRTWGRLGWAALIAVCAGMFLLTLYPAWQIPLLYLLLVCIVWLIVAHWGTVRMRVRDWWMLGVVVLAFAAIMSIVVVNSYSTIVATLHTAYPGQRTSTGGGISLWSLVDGGAGMLFGVHGYVGAGNSSEAAHIVDLFPIGVLVALYQLLWKRVRDILTIGLLILVTLSGWFMVFGFPSWLAKITLFSYVTPIRCYLLFAVANLALLVRALSNVAWRVRPRTAIYVGTAYGVFVAMACRAENAAYVGRHTFWIIVVIIAVITAACILLSSRVQTRIRSLLGAVAIAVVIVLGMTVNPIQYGADTLTDQAAVSEAAAIDATSPGEWAVVGTNSAQVPMLLAANGVAALNTVQVTPILDTWRILDPEGKWESYYNRYSYISLQVVTIPASEPFAVPYADTLVVSVTADQLHDMGVDYVMSKEELTNSGTSSTAFTLLRTTSDGYHLYSLTAH